RRAEEEARAEARERTRAEQAEAEARDHLYLSLIAQARLEWRLNNVDEAERLLQGCEPERRGWEWHYLSNVNRTNLFPATSHAYRLIGGVHFSPDGRRLLFTGWAALAGAADRDAAPLEIWDALSGQ